MNILPARRPFLYLWLPIFLLLALGSNRVFASIQFTNGPAPLTISLTAKIIVGATVLIDAATGRPFIDPDTRKPIPSLYSVGAKTFDRAGRKTSETDAFAGRILSAKYGNAEFIADLISAGVIADTGIKGWGLFALRNGNTYRVEARKTGRPSIDLSSLVSVQTRPVVSGYSRTRTTNYKNRLPDATTGAGTFTQEGTVQVSFASLGDAQGPLIPAFSLTGTMVASGSEHRWYPEPPKRHPQLSTDLRAGVRINGLFGAYLPPGWPQEREDASGNPALFVTGSASFGPEAAVRRP